MSDNAFPVDMQPAPKGLLDKLGVALPVALTAIATAFAGLSSSEMSRAMYHRSEAAQDQSKANDQWSVAAHKRDRSLIMHTAALQLRDNKFEVIGDQPDNAAAREWVQRSGPPPQTFPAIDDPAINEVLEAGRAGKPEAELLRAARAVNRIKLEEAIDRATAELKRIETEWQPVLDSLARYLATAIETHDRNQQAKHMQVEQRRYRIEANLNQQLGHLYEVRVKTSTLQSERHHSRSDNFFYAMLAGQAGATLAALALARKRQSGLWLGAGLIGTVSVGFGAYVYLTM